METLLESERCILPGAIRPAVLQPVFGTIAVVLGTLLEYVLTNDLPVQRARTLLQGEPVHV